MQQSSSQLRKFAFHEIDEKRSMCHIALIAVAIISIIQRLRDAYTNMKEHG